MSPIHPQSLGDTYPALCNFLKLTALTLGVPQLALLVQTGVDPRHSGVLNYGHITQVFLRQIVEQPLGSLTAITEALSLGTLYRPPSVGLEEGLSAQTAHRPVLVGRLQAPHTTCLLTLYIPGLTAKTLTAVQLKTLSYLSHQLLLCLQVGPPPPTAAQTTALPPWATQAEEDDIDFLSRVVSLHSPHSALQGRVQPRPPSLVDLVTNLQSCLSYKQLGQRLEAHLPGFFPHQSGRLVLLSGNPPSFTVLTSWGQDQPFLELDQQCCFFAEPPLDSVSGGCQSCHQCNLAQAQAPTSTCIRLGTINQVACILQVTRSGEESLNLGQTTVLEKLSEQILCVMQRLFLLEDLQEQALRDPLTGLLNRRAMETVLTSLCQTANVEQQISIILIDVDHFKTVNDTYGHPAGDMVLKTLGIVLKGHVRGKDIVCRYGGEEFCMVLLDTPLAVALKRAEKIRRAIKYLTPAYQGKSLAPLTVSLGVASFPDHSQEPEALLNYADQALYWAKNHGRDRTVSADLVLAEHQSS
jgi:diguanylate cyclase (GGDEF)-like protein